ncbi:pseudouridine-5'-phosphate glycosidase [Candidatus Sumerlaeota bacterium]|nr:pseudouridine-5'-phosphate glycosidase [Candidatus Sumerlaeota bacterium]
MVTRPELNTRLPIDIQPEVYFALRTGQPIVAFETTILSFGLPQPLNMEVALGCEKRARDLGVIPASIAMLDGRIHIGLEKEQLEFFCSKNSEIRKVNPQNFASTLAMGKPGAFTVGGCLMVCALVGIRVFATGGIGGIHRDWQVIPDVSSDLQALSRYQTITVSAGAKSILNIPATLEALETLGVPVVGWNTDKFPLFHCPTSQYPVSARFDTAKDVAEFAKLHFQLNTGGILLAAPIPAEHAIEFEQLEKWITIALKEASEQQVHGRDITPFLLERLEKHSAGKSLEANTELIFNNSTIAAQIALELAKL